MWGKITDSEKHKGYGLAHILDKHPDFDVFKIPEIIESGRIEKTYNGYNIVTDEYIVGLNKGFKDEDGNIINDSNVWVVTSFEPQAKAKKEASSIASVTSNYNEPMPQKPLDIIQQTQESKPTKEIIKEAKAQGKSVKETKEAIKENKEAQQTKALQEPTKEASQKVAVKEDIQKSNALQNLVKKEKQFKEKYKAQYDEFNAIRRQNQNKINEVWQEIKNMPEFDISVDSPMKKAYYKLEAKLKRLRKKIDKEHDKLGMFDFFKEYQQQEAKLYIPEHHTHLNFSTNDKGSQENTLQYFKDLRNDIEQDADYKSRKVARKAIQEVLGIKPIDSFGMNFAEHYHNGSGAINKLLVERQGQVAGAFYKEGLGDIDLVWGDSTFGLAHILERRTDDFMKQGFSKEEAEAKALEFIRSLPDIIENGEIIKKQTRVFIDTQDSRVLVALDYKGKDKKWIITAYEFNDLSKADTHLTKLNTSTSSVSRDSVVTGNSTTNEPQNPNNKVMPYQNQSKAEILQAQEGFKNGFLNAAESVMQNNFISKASYAKFKNLKLDSFFDDFQIKGMRDLGKSYRDGNDYIRIIDGQLENNNTFRIYQYDPSPVRKDEFINKMVLEIFTPDDKLAKRLSLRTSIEHKRDYKDDIVNTILNHVEFTIHDGKKQKNLKYITNKRSAQYDVREAELTGEKKPLLGYGEWDEFMKLEGSGGIRFYEGIPIVDTRSGNEYAGYTQTWQVQGKEFNTLKEAKEYIQAIKEPFTQAEEKELANIYKKFEIEQDAWNTSNYTIKPKNRYSDVLHGKLELQEFKKPTGAYELQRENYIFLNELVKKHHNPYGIAFKLTGNYANPVEFLTTVKLGYVENAFYKEGLGDIDLVWGDSTFGLAHILEKHGDEFESLGGVAKALSEIIENGEVVKTHNGYNIIWGDYKVGLNVGWNDKGKKIGNNKWIVTAFDNSKSLREKQGSNSVSITKDETLPLNSKTDSTTKTFNMADTNIDKLEDFLYYAKLAGFEENEALRKLHKKMRLKKIQKEILC